MSCCSGCGLSPADVPDSQIYVILIPGAKRFSVNVFQPADNNGLSDNCGGCVNPADLVIPATITIVSSEVRIYAYGDTETPILTDTPSITDILDSEDQLIGYKLSYLVATGVLPVLEAGLYMIVFQYELDTGEIYVVPLYFKAVAIGFLNDGC